MYTDNLTETKTEKNCHNLNHTDGNYRIRTRDKMVEFSLTVYTLSCCNKKYGSYQGHEKFSEQSWGNNGINTNNCMLTGSAEPMV